MKPVNYKLSLNRTHQHEFSVTMEFYAESDGVSELVLPSWLPGSYMIRDFSKNISDLSAENERGESLVVSKQDKQTWHVQSPQGKVVVQYRVYAWDLSVRTAYIDQTRAYFNGSSLFMRLSNSESQPHFLSLSNEGHTSSTVATSMKPLDIDLRGFGLYEAASYENLIDYPFEIGLQSECSFDVAGIQHRMVFTDAIDCDLPRIVKDVAPICAEHVAMFGELPVEHYLFMTLATADGYGGLEHCNSTSLLCKRTDLPYAQMDKASTGYRQFLALCSHEYFHLWNVKRIKPAILQNSPLTQETHTELLWAFEGITSYYDELALTRSGCIDTTEYLDMLAPTITRVIRAKGRFRQSVAESSYDAWTKFYKQDENAPNAICSYYAKGTLVAFGLDHLLRTQSDDQLCLDDLMRHLWNKFGKTQIGVPERGIESEVALLIGTSVQVFFDAYVYGTEELPLQAWFADFGIGYRLSAGTDLDKLGGYTEKPEDTTDNQIALGARTATVNGMLKVQQVFSQGAAQHAGIAPDDILLALDGEQCTQDNLPALLSRKPLGEVCEFTLFRRGRLMTLPYTILAAEQDTCQLWLLEDLESSVLKRRKSWLSSSRKGVAV